MSSVSYQPVPDVRVGEWSMPWNARDGVGWLGPDLVYRPMDGGFLRKRSPEHRGGTFLTVNGEPPRRIHGEFWTSRDTKGTLDMVAHVPAVAQTYADAEALFPTLSLGSAMEALEARLDDPTRPEQ